MTGQPLQCQPVLVTRLKGNDGQNHNTEWVALETGVLKNLRGRLEGTQAGITLPLPPLLSGWGQTAPTSVEGCTEKLKNWETRRPRKPQPEQEVIWAHFSPGPSRPTVQHKAHLGPTQLGLGPTRPWPTSATRGQTETSKLTLPPDDPTCSRQG